MIGSPIGRKSETFRYLILPSATAWTCTIFEIAASV